MKSLGYNIYKGMGNKFGAAQFNFSPAHYYCSGKCKTKNYENETQLCDCKDTKMIARDGCVFLEITSTKAANVYDWDNKIVMALSVNDLGKIITGLRQATEVKLLHDPGAKSESAGKVKKTLSFGLPSEKGCVVTATEYNEMNADAPKKHTVPMTLDEVTILVTLFERAISRCLSW